jgi:acyl-CoA synthetase (AMP-forming)/AMP-acid ligase II
VVTQHRVAGRAITLFVLGADGTETELRTELARVLPPYMVPTDVVLIDEKDVGLTPTGKLDRGRLRELVASDDR